MVEDNEESKSKSYTLVSTRVYGGGGVEVVLLRRKGEREGRTSVHFFRFVKQEPPRQCFCVRLSYRWSGCEGTRGRFGDMDQPRSGRRDLSVSGRGTVVTGWG